MAIYSITTAQKNALENKIKDIKALLGDRRILWMRLSQEKRQEWKTSCPDPIIAFMYNLYLYLKDFFGD